MEVVFKHNFINQMITLEKRFYDICSNLKYKITYKVYDIYDKQLYHYKQIFYNDKEILMEFNSKSSILWCDYRLIWMVFETEYDMTYEQIQGFIKTQMEVVFKPKELTPFTFVESLSLSMEEPFKHKELTPLTTESFYYARMEEAFKRKELTPNYYF